MADINYLSVSNRQLLLALNPFASLSLFPDYDRRYRRCTQRCLVSILVTFDLSDSNMFGSRDIEEASALLGANIVRKPHGLR